MRIRIKKNELFFIFILLPHINPEFLQRIQVTELLINGWRLATIGIILFFILKYKVTLSSVFYIIAIMQAYVSVLTVLNKGNISSKILGSFTILCVLMIYEFAIQYDVESFIKAQFFVFEIAVYINLLTIILFPHGLYQAYDSLNRKAYVWRYWFLGYYTGFLQYYVPAIVFAFLYKYYFKQLIRPMCLCVASLLSVLFVWMGAGIICMVFMIFALLFLMNYTHIFNYFNYWIMLASFYLFIIVLQLQNLFLWLIQGILHKGANFQIRINIWEAARKRIHENPIFGYGVELPEVRHKKLWGVLNSEYGHNLIIEVLYQGGFVFLTIFLVIIILTGRKIYPTKETEVGKIISVGFFGWCINSMSDASMTPFLMGLFIMAFYIEKFISIDRNCDGIELFSQFS